MTVRRRLVLCHLADVTTLAERKYAGSFLLRQAHEDGNLTLAVELTALTSTTYRHWLPADVVNRRET